MTAQGPLQKSALRFRQTSLGHSSSGLTQAKLDALLRARKTSKYPWRSIPGEREGQAALRLVPWAFPLNPLQAVRSLPRGRSGGGDPRGRLRTNSLSPYARRPRRRARAPSASPNEQLLFSGGRGVRTSQEFDMPKVLSQIQRGQSSVLWQRREPDRLSPGRMRRGG